MDDALSKSGYATNFILKFDPSFCDGCIQIYQLSYSYLCGYNTILMKHEEVVAALKVIAEKGLAINITKPDLQELKKFNLITIGKGEEAKRSPACTLTKKGRVMLKANLPKPEKTDEAEGEEDEITD